MKSWVKLYTEMNHDPKVLTLTWAQRGIWTALLAVAGEIDDRDENGIETGRIDTLEYAAIRLRCDEDEFNDAIEEFVSRGMIDIRDDVLWLPNYGRRQGRAPSSRPAAVAERVKRHREKSTADCNEDVTRVKQPVTPTDTDTDTDTETNEPATPGAIAPTNLEEWLALIEKPPNGSNRTAVLQNMVVTLFQGRDPPEYSYVGKVAREASGAGQLAQLLWQASGQRITGDPLSYCQAVIQRRKKERKNGNDNGQRLKPVERAPE